MMAKTMKISHKQENRIILLNQDMNDWNDASNKVMKLSFACVHLWDKCEIWEHKLDTEIDRYLWDNP